MISKLDKTIFIHIPKTGGQSIERVFLRRANLDWEQRDQFLLKRNRNPKSGPPRLAHLTASEYHDYEYLSLEQWHEFFKFAFVRNPWQSAWSEYCYRQYDCSFDYFLLKRFPTKTHDNYTSGDDLYRHIIPQSEFIFDHRDTLKVDFIGRFETINEDFRTLSLQLFGHDEPLPHVNKSPQKKVFNFFYKNNVSYRDAYSDKGVQFIERFYARDIELLSYSFE